MKDKLDHINANPCKMCFPLGVVTAFYGLKGGLTLLHGSQGCSAYIRRHMATHYNEPVDIASSSLTEEGTVFGGEANLKKGLDNLIRLYNPEVIGVGTTCLAETIGEDVEAILRDYQNDRPNLRTRLIPVASAGYSGTHYEGWFKGARAVVENAAQAAEERSSVNVFVPPSSPADLRELKRLLTESGLEFVLFPDISHNLDRPYEPVYKRLPDGGTAIEDIGKMAGARASVELSRFCPPSLSPGAYLEENFGVPLIRLNPPVGLRDNDAFLKALKSLGGRVSQETLAQRGRYLDAMLDAHKHSAVGRAAIYGDPDLVYALCRLGAENGFLPVVAATGSVSPHWAELVWAEIKPLAASAHWDKLAVKDAADFDDIERWSVSNGVNLLIGSSEGRRLAARQDWPLTRCAFPVHDRQGGARIRLYGFEGSTILLDNLVNDLRGREEGAFRERLKTAYYQAPVALAETGYLTESLAPAQPVSEAGLEQDICFGVTPEPSRPSIPSFPSELADPSFQRPAWGLPRINQHETHPCFSLEAAHVYARLHLPVAPACNLSCGYCRRDFDCPNESRPGVTSQVLNPRQALERFMAVRAKLPNLKIVGLAGPGESLANFPVVAETIKLIRQQDPETQFCLSTNGLLLPLYVERLNQLGVKYLTITINTLDTRVGAQIYREVNYLDRLYQGSEGAALILANQLGGLKMAVELGISVKVNTVVLRKINQDTVAQVAKATADLGATIGNVMRHLPVEGSYFAHLPQISRAELQKISWECQAFLPQMRHCRQCRADAVGLLGEDLSYQFRPGQPKPTAESVWSLNKPIGPQIRVAVISKSGLVVDQHFGQADRLFIYESDGAVLKLLENRKVDLGVDGCRGGFCGLKDPLAAQKPDGFIARLVIAASDCDAVVAMRVGQSPRDKLAARGILALTSFDAVDQAVLTAAQAVLAQRSAGGQMVS
ncbi:MAG: radical SAM protein [Deltaproteobacteria bacterium]|jgi:nitrogenase molybdenum-iron protein alpha/beta subunit/MoaA/NifB/PqqE/SkfB family radical SAM enzyme|nr:radical SAM protein [Deltaproteobacteria bacterium]